MDRHVKDQFMNSLSDDSMIVGIICELTSLSDTSLVMSIQVLAWARRVEAKRAQNSMLSQS